VIIRNATVPVSTIHSMITVDDTMYRNMMEGRQRADGSISVPTRDAGPRWTGHDGNTHCPLYRAGIAVGRSGQGSIRNGLASSRGGAWRRQRCGSGLREVHGTFAQALYQRPHVHGTDVTDSRSREDVYSSLSARLREGPSLPGSGRGSGTLAPPRRPP
jgi:hypothetical protein